MRNPQSVLQEGEVGVVLRGVLQQVLPQVKKQITEKCIQYSGFKGEVYFLFHKKTNIVQQ